MRILIGGAWPYANGSLHIGHLAALLPGDVLARYHRQKGDEVSYVSGSDCHGTPVVLRARQEGLSPREVSDKYHLEFSDCFRRLGFSYDHYGKTSDPGHKAFVTEFHRTMYDQGYVYEKEEEQAYCEHCGQFLPDRFITGTCPLCGGKARGDQCEACNGILEPERLIDSRCGLCGHEPVFRRTRHLYLAITRLKEKLEDYLALHPGWRRNAFEATKRYIREGLRDRAITRDLDWGIDVPREGYEEKRIYIWWENVLGYLSASLAHANETGRDIQALWGKDAKHYFVHGKDNIPFHTIILPSLLLAHGGGWRLPDEIISSEHLTLEGRKISTSADWAIWVKDIVGCYNPDTIRYFFLTNGPEKRDSDFSWREFIHTNNGELLGAYGNLVNRTLVFVHKSFGGIIPEGTTDENIQRTLRESYERTGALIEKGEFKAALSGVFDCIRGMNKYFDEERPWVTIREDRAKCADTLYNCANAIQNLAVLLHPFLPFSSEKVLGWLGGSDEWQYRQVKPGQAVGAISILFERLHPDVIEKELGQLGKKTRRG
ncbi:MAG: methionine--tRNA ligase [Clostridia bacterium]